MEGVVGGGDSKEVAGECQECWVVKGEGTGVTAVKTGVVDLEEAEGAEVRVERGCEEVEVVVKVERGREEVEVVVKVEREGEKVEGVAAEVVAAVELLAEYLPNRLLERHLQ